MKLFSYYLLKWLAYAVLCQSFHHIKDKLSHHNILFLVFIMEEINLIIFYILLKLYHNEKMWSTTLEKLKITSTVKKLKEKQRSK